ncbi:MAG: LD-carboxypeptidase [Candidatus Daviesbacteria bacterium]|nr:LD-carboxypeptidase [Candidatus Daviesbacteria bacterium]
MKIIKPAKLNIGDTIGIVASSLPVLPSHKERFERGKRLIEDMGFRIKEGKTIGQRRWWMAGTPKEVAEDINAMFADQNIKAVIVHTGGYSAISVIEHLDYELIAHNTKPFIGMSDMTIYHLAILAKTGMVGFHMDDLSYGFGREIKQGMENWPKLNQEFFLKFLTENKAPGIIKPVTEWEEWKKGRAEGYLMGGILERISTLAGTKYFPSEDFWDGSILFWEEIGRDLSEMYQYLHQLKNMGIFERINGMLVGKIKYLKPLREASREEIIEPSLKEMILDTVKDYDFPIMANMDFGHFTVNIPMPLGIKVSFDTTKKELNFLEGAVI